MVNPLNTIWTMGSLEGLLWVLRDYYYETGLRG
jgi:hypothetical protein